MKLEVCSMVTVCKPFLSDFCVQGLPASSIVKKLVEQFGLEGETGNYCLIQNNNGGKYLHTPFL